jgi:hypothetical protein
VFFGALQGVYLTAHKLLMELRPQAATRRQSLAVSMLKVFCTFHLMVFSFIFFRAPDFSTAGAFITGILNWHGGFPWQDGGKLVFYALLTLGLDVPQFRSGDHTIMLRWHWVARGIAYAAMALMLAELHTDREIPFIYFQF